MTSCSRRWSVSLHVCWAFTLLLLVIGLETASAEDDQESKRAPRMRLFKREMGDSAFERDIKAPRLRFFKRDLDGLTFERDTKAPRLRFFKRDIDEPVFERDAKAPRLRFFKRDMEDFTFERDAKAPRLRFFKRSVPNEQFQESDQSPSDSGSRERRSAFDQEVAKRRFSINNDIRAIADMIYYTENRRRFEAEQALRQKLLDIGKRSP